MLIQGVTEENIGKVRYFLRVERQLTRITKDQKRNHSTEAFQSVFSIARLHINAHTHIHIYNTCNLILIEFFLWKKSID